MKNENLEDKVGEASFLQKIRSSVKKQVIGYLMGVSLSLGTIYGSGCGESVCCENLTCNDEMICKDVDPNGINIELLPHEGYHCIFDSYNQPVECCACTPPGVPYDTYK